MAVSKKRDKTAYKVPRNIGKGDSQNPKWLLPTAVTALVIGPLWIVVYYISRGQYPFPINYLNIVIGFIFMGGAMVLLTRWK